MGTTWSEVITDYAMLEINDIRLQQESAQNPAQFFRRMSAYMKNAIPRFTSPPEEREWLSHTPPQFWDTAWTAPAGGEAATLETGQTGFEMMSVVEAQAARTGETLWVPYTEASYDPETGDVRFPAGIPEGTRFRLDFFTDGVFDYDLSAEEKTILGLFMKLLWTRRFAGDWLNMQPKVKDKSFSTGAESNQIRAMTERGTADSYDVYAQMATYAQNVEYLNLLRQGRVPTPRRP